MSISLRKNSTPITSIDTNFLDFITELKKFNEIIEERLKDEDAEKEPKQFVDEFILKADKTARLKEEVCRKHEIPLTKNGINPRTVYSSNGEAFKGFKVQRYKCKECGKYSPNYGNFIPKHANYQKEVKAKARHLVYLGNTPGEVVKIFDKVGEVVPSASSIRNWVREAPLMKGRGKDSIGTKRYNARGLYKSKKYGYIHSDVNGAFNIGRLLLPLFLFQLPL